ncbi:MAG: HD domain-containing protein, partial [Burkholderiaceae bacterium]
MVATVASADAVHVQLCAGLGAEDSARVQRALDFVQPLYAGKKALTGQDALQFAQTAASVLAMLETDADTRIVGLLFELPALDTAAAERIEAEFGHEIAEFVAGVRQLIRLHALAFGWQPGGRGKNAAQVSGAQVETLRKMLLAMASDMRVVLVRMASRVTTLRYLTERKVDNEDARRYARETFELYAPLANRLGVWQLKWELEDLSFRLLEPAAYKRIAKMLEERRIERQSFVQEAITRLQAELAAAGVAAEVSGRPKHIYSIWNKMRGKELDFSELYDVRALRVIVGDVKSCYTALGIVHHIWTPVPSEFDDYISRPKTNGYRSLHTVVTA